MAALFQPDRSLLYPQFETYRLSSFDDDAAAYPLPGAGATQSRVGYNTHLLSFKETRARISWDHLATYGNRGVYVDAEWNVVGFVLNSDLTPTFSTLASLPVPISSTQTAQHPEYPSAVALSEELWLIATGTGSLYVLETPAGHGRLTARFTARYDLTGDAGELAPFLVQAAHYNGTCSRVLFSRSIPQKDASRKSSSDFELLEATLDPAASNGVDDAPGQLDVTWRLVGEDLPVWTKWKEGGWIVLSGQVFGKQAEEIEETEAESKKREHKAKVEKLGLGASLPPGEDAEDVEMTEVKDYVDEEEEKAWPFSWTQNGESVTVTFELQPGTTKKDITVGLTSSALSLSITRGVSEPLQTFLRKETRTFWTSIDPSESTWTYSADEAKLELDLSKKETNTRWPSVFSPPDEDDDEDDDEVPETLSPDVLAAVRASFNNIKTRGDDEPAGNHPAIPALIREEMDYDLEDGEDFGQGATGVFGEPGGGTKVGRDVYVGYIKADGVASWSKSQSTVVSVPIGQRDDSIMVKSAVDALRFESQGHGDSFRPTRDAWRHLSTSPALSFVLSSKRDLRLVRHALGSNGSSGATVLAFDAGGTGAASGNAYVYFAPTCPTVAQQGIIRVSGAERGALLGVGEVDAGGRPVITALCERALVVLDSVPR